ncbi:hypothetical protein [Natrinema marinum]|uniref:hypothetical protein n=1 Tax=Natrinema marinum TaxID=2961598 RepID=UPI0020C901F3|nr:hypothetical protein [Natrinema marinum]
MDERTIAGLVGTATIAVLAVIGVFGFSSGYLIDPPTSIYLAPTVAILVVAVLVVGGLAALGAGSRRWRENPYW